MSLINDALKRAKAAQDQHTDAPPPSLEFRPAEPRPPAAKGFWSAKLVFVIIGLAALLFTWQTSRNHSTAGTGRQEVQARSLESKAGESMPNSAPIATAPPVTKPAPEPASSQTDSSTNLNIAAEPPPKPPEPRLQAIFYTRTRPSAVINGKTYFIGDKMGASKVVAIDQESVTLVSGGQTNLMSLGL